ncbi:MAG: rhamnan synthesis F family protein, partial [Janthinobacterium lividum]
MAKGFVGMYAPHIQVSLSKPPHLSRIARSVEPTWPPHLHEVVDRPDRQISQIERAWGFLRRPKFRGSLVRAGLILARDWFAAAIADLNLRFRAEPTIVWLQNGIGGEDALLSVRSLALYVHYSPSGHVSEMVHDQIDAYRRLGFTVLFVTMAPEMTADAIARLSESCALIVRRHNHGLDFGAWHDLVPIIQARAPQLEEMLLVNDSICGPLRPLEPVLSVFRGAGNGLFGLSENLAPRPHLQSYFLLIRGFRAIADALAFLTAFKPTGDKRRTIRRGEVAFTVWMRRRGHAIAAFCGYDRVERAALGHAVARERVRILYPWRFAGIAADLASDPDAMCLALRKSPLNATHLFWRELVEDFGLPFVKTDLLLRNPLGVSDPLDWRSVVSEDCDRALKVHIAD